MTKNQAEWASNHDWFTSYYEDLDGVWVVVVKDPIEGGELHRSQFISLVELKAWAGY